MTPEDLGPVPQAPAPVDEESEEDGLVDGEGVGALDRPGSAERSRVPPVARGEELQGDQPVGDVAVAPQGPQEEPAQRRDQNPGHQRAVRDALRLLWRARGVSVPPDARFPYGAGVRSHSASEGPAATGACAGGGGADGGGPAGRGTRSALVPRLPYVPSVSMNRCPLTSHVPPSAPVNLVPGHGEFSNPAGWRGSGRHSRPGRPSVRRGQGHAPSAPDRSMPAARPRP